MRYEYGKHIFDIILGFGIIITGFYWLSHKKSGVRLLKQYSLGLFSKKIYEKVLLIICIFFVFVGVIALIFGIKGMFLL
jgi:hypothetical protein